MRGGGPGGLPGVGGRGLREGLREPVAGSPRGRGCPGTSAAQSTALAETGSEQPTCLLSRGWCVCRAPGRSSQDTLGPQPRTGIASTHPDGRRQTPGLWETGGRAAGLGSESTGLLAQLSGHGHMQGEGHRDGLSAPRGGDAVRVPEGTVHPLPQRHGLYPYTPSRWPLTSDQETGVHPPVRWGREAGGWGWIRGGRRTSCSLQPSLACRPPPQLSGLALALRRLLPSSSPALPGSPGAQPPARAQPGHTETSPQGPAPPPPRPPPPQVRSLCHLLGGVRPGGLAVRQTQLREEHSASRRAGRPAPHSPCYADGRSEKRNVSSMERTETAGTGQPCACHGGTRPQLPGTGMDRDIGPITESRTNQTVKNGTCSGLLVDGVVGATEACAGRMERARGLGTRWRALP